MPRGNKRNASGSTGPARRSSRTPAKSEPEPVKKTRGSSTGDASPAKSARKASPSPAPTSRGRSSKARGKTPLQGQGDAETKSRVTRAVIKEKEDEKSEPNRGRSTTRRGNKAEEPVPEPVATKASRSKSTGTPKGGKATPKKAATPKGGRGRSARGRGKQEEEVESEDEPEEEEEEEEPPKKATPKSTPKAKSRTPAKSKAKTPSPAKTTKTTPKPAASRSRSRGGKAEEVSPQVVLEKMDASDYESPEKKEDATEKTTDTTAEPEVKSPRGRQARKAVVKATPSPRPGRSRRGVQKDEEEAVDMPEESEKVEETAAASEKMNEEVVAAKDDEGTSAVSETNDENTPDVSIEVNNENPAITVTVDEESAAVSSKVDEENTDETVKEDQGTLSISNKADDETPVISVKVVEETAVISEKVDETPVADKDAMEITEEQLVSQTVIESGKEDAAEVPVVNADIATDAVDISDEDSSSVVVEPALSVQISDDSQSVPADDEPAVVKVNTVIQNDPEPVVPVQNSVIEEPEAMETESIENNDGAVKQTETVDGEQNGETDCRKRKLDEVDEIVDDGAVSKKACVSGEVVEQIQENGETTQSVEDVKVSTTQFLDDVTTHTPEEEYVMINMEEVPGNNSKEVLESLPQTQQTIESVKTNNDNVDKLGPLFNRTVILNPSFTGGDPAKQFSVASYNILAQCHLEKNDYSFSSPEYLALQHRHQKMMREFQFLDADVVCLQEVSPSYFTNTLEPAMKSMGYTGVMKKRTQEDFDEGEATFWKDSRFSLVHCDTLSVARLSDKEVEDAGLDDDTKNAVLKYIDMPDVLVLTQLKCNFTNNCVTVGNIHVQWGRMEVPDIQCIQIACAIKALVNLAGSDTNPHILCGDFNSEVTSPGYQLVLDGYLSDEMIDKLQSLANLVLPDGSKKALFNQLYRAFQHPSSSIKSSYLTAQGKEPTVTSYNQVMRAAVDYIFYSSNSLDVKGVLEVAPEAIITGTGGIPDATFPSDHVSIKSILSFK